jgi:hypothetical protein
MSQIIENYGLPFDDIFPYNENRYLWASQMPFKNESGGVK